MPTIIECQPDEGHPERVFRVTDGDVTSNTADVVVLSAHAVGPLPGDHPFAHTRWGGGALCAFVEAHGDSTVRALRRYVSFESRGRYAIDAMDERAGTWAGVWAAPRDPDERRWLVVVRAPGTATDEAGALRATIEGVIATVSAIAAQRGTPCRSVAMTNLFAHRRYDVSVRVSTLLQQVQRWYRGTLGVDSVEVVLFEQDAERLACVCEEWRAAVQREVGWTPISPDPATEALRLEVRARVGEHLREEQDGSIVRETLVDLQRRLDPEHRRALQEIAQAGRALAEAMSAELCSAYGLPVNANAYSNLEQLRAIADSESAIHGLSRSYVAKWIVSYLHTLRTLGNEAAHAVKEHKARFPRTLEADDLFVLLAQLRRVLDFRARWCASRRAP
jgi:hypothetical protein